jgi:SAM-dependent methyltransferase
MARRRSDLPPSVEPTMAGREDGWTHPSQAWERYTSPQRPHRDDTAVVERVAAELAGQGSPLRAIMLGVTPETAGCAWPAGTRLRAFDGSVEMIGALWPAPGAPAGARAELADWGSLPLGDGETDLVTGDNALAVIYWPEPVIRVVDEVRRVLRPGGRFVVRQPILPDRRETREAILEDLKAGRIETPGVVKARLWATLHRPGWDGMAMQEMRDLWWSLFPDPEAVAKRLGWSAAQFAMLRKIADGRRTTCVTREQLLEIFEPRFRIVEWAVGSYQLAERFPTLVLEPR